MDAQHIVYIRIRETTVFYDDNVWIGLDMAKWYAISKDVRYLNQAKAVWDYLSQYGWDNTCGGGVSLERAE